MSAGWQPIETAPRDGTEMLGYGSYVYDAGDPPTHYMRLFEYDASNPDFPWVSDEGAHPDGFFTHWMPLPAPPASA